jgi:hypothetical protein
MGNDYSMTSGCLFIESEVVMSSSKFTNFRAGAIFTVADKYNNFRIQDCLVNYGSIVGIYC